jgi:hypothetical protein
MRGLCRQVAGSIRTRLGSGTATSGENARPMQLRDVRGLYRYVGPPSYGEIDNAAADFLSAGAPAGCADSSVVRPVSSHPGSRPCRPSSTGYITTQPAC